MAKKTVISTLMISILAMVVCLFSPFAARKVSNAAQIENVSGNNFVLTERVGSSKEHYFLNDSGEETLVNAEAKKDGEYYSIVSSKNGASSGYSDIALTNDMMPFIEEGILFARATAEVSTENGTLKLIISSGEKTAEVQTASAINGVVTTPLIKIDNFDESVKFTFETTGGKFVMKKPTIQLHTQIDEVVLNEEAIQTVSPGQMVKVDAYNAATQISGTTGNFMNFSKINHEINYHLIKGDNLVKIIGSKLYISETAKTGDTIVFDVYSKKNSFSSETISSKNTVTLVVDASKVVIKVDKHFSDAATITGEGEYGLDRGITLRVAPKKDYEFLGWYINGVFESTNKMLYIEQAKPGMQIFAKFSKNITIQSISVKRVYDGTSANITKDNVFVSLSGLEAGDQLTLDGINYESCSFVSANVGTNKAMNMSYGKFSLVDENGNISDLYNLVGQTPEALGEITKREVVLSASSAQKEYGNSDPVLTIASAQNVVDGERLNVSLSREKANTLEGEKIGKYKITLGNMETQNPNYHFVLDKDAYLQITKRTLQLQNMTVVNKVYDGTCSATITANLGNVFNAEDVSVRIKGAFAKADVSDDVEVKITSCELVGKDKDNYTLADFKDTLYGKITARPLKVTALSCTFVYGDEVSLKYITEGIVSGDTLSGSLVIENKNAGEHQILLGNLSNSNYLIEFVSAKCVILPRILHIKAIGTSKTYGDSSEPTLEYTALDLLDGDTIEGSPVRDPGEDVGNYRIRIGDLSCANYNIIFTEALFQILPREIGVEVTFKDKEYDKTMNVDFDLEFSNNIKNENFDIDIKTELNDMNCGTRTVSVTRYTVRGINIKNYKFTYEIVRDQIEITKRSATVFVDAQTKTYGDVDPIFAFTARNLILGDRLDLRLSRESGEDVGTYSYFIDEENKAKNPNYDISIAAVDFEILPKKVTVSVKSDKKFYGSEDPEFVYSVQEKFAFGMTAEDVIDGKILRESGEEVGTYEYDVSELSSSKNYVFVKKAGTYFKIEKRPIVVKLLDDEKFYGDEDPIFKYDIDNFIEGEKLNVEISRSSGEDVGDYDLTCKEITHEHFEVEIVGAKFKIKPCKIKIKADDQVKIYGEKDPEPSITIIDGYLKKGESLSELLSGSLERDKGENAGFHTIDIGNLSLGKNYEIDFVPGTLHILQRKLVITPRGGSKIYGEVDSTLEYDVSGEGLAFDDTLSGSLSRASGENARKYEITLGTLTAGDNYEIELVKAEFEIEKRTITIVPTTLSREYGDEEVEIKYQILGKLVEGDTLFGELYREKMEVNKIGKYKILSSLNNPNYNIVLQDQYFTILPREVVIKADDIEIEYGQEPVLSYTIVSGSLVDGDEVKGELKWLQNNAVGTYEIFSDLNIGPNYNLVCINGTLKITPRELTIKAPNMEKTYGQEDPRFTYEIVKGELLKGDRLYGMITREEGEDVGEYDLVCNLFNGNYNILLEPAKLEIKKKDVYLISQIYDKIYDGKTTASLKNPHVSGLIDEVYLKYDTDNCADFESAQVGEGISVFLHDITLSGTKAFNYNLILPTDLYANITLREIVNEDVKVSAKDPVLYENYQLQFSSESIKNQAKIDNHKLVLAYDIWIDSEEVTIQPDNLYTITINLPQKIFNKNNIYVYQENENGEIVSVASAKGSDQQIVITASSLGHFYITVEDDSWMTYATLASIIVLSLLISFAVGSIIKKSKKRKNQG